MVFWHAKMVQIMDSRDSMDSMDMRICRYPGGMDVHMGHSITWYLGMLDTWQSSIYATERVMAYAM